MMDVNFGVGLVQPSALRVKAGGGVESEECLEKYLRHCRARRAERWVAVPLPLTWS